MAISKSLSRRALILTIVLWALAVVSHAVWYVTSILSGPPSGDLYANHVSFQLLMFGLLRLPIWLIVLPLVIAIETAVAGKKF
jgi:hypothetical protein